MTYGQFLPKSSSNLRSVIRDSKVRGLSLHVGHARRIRPVFNYRITDLEAQIKTKTNLCCAIANGHICA